MSIKWFKNKQEFAKFINHELDELSSRRIKKDLLRQFIKQELLWDWTEYTKDNDDNPLEIKGHTKGCQYWSKAALQGFFDLSSEKIELKGEIFYKEKEDKIRTTHEHVIPRAILADEIIKLKDDPKRNERTIYDFLNKYAKGCIITTSENQKLKEKKVNQKLPNNIQTVNNISNLWTRYISAGINNIYKCSWKKIGQSWRLIDYKKINLKDFDYK